MPPSPALRYSPQRNRGAENRNRGNSFEGTLLLRGKDDDDLALFNEMQSKESENFLLQSFDDLEDTFSTKLQQFSDVKLGISIPARGESSELLDVEGEKNDYDWLITPPDSPLFPSLDDDPQQVNVSNRGRPQSQPITILRQSTMDKSYRSSRGSASPNRFSPSPRSGSSSLQSQGRPSSVPHSCSPQGHRPMTPTHRPSPPPVKPSPRGVSPVRTNRGNAASPKIRSWQSNIPGFSSEAPPNLRTDRPATYMRGSSPASRNGRESSYRYGRQSMSPTPSRSVSSWHSQDRDRVSSNSRGSVTSSGDDDLDSLQSIQFGSLDRFASSRTEMLSSNRVPTLSKKPTKILAPSSAPKRSFDTALRHVDHRKGPQNMFRPLLSSVPSSTFYVGKPTSIQSPLMSQSSSILMNSNAVSDRHEDIAVESEKTISDAPEEVFAFDKFDMPNKDVDHDTNNGPGQFPAVDFDQSHGTNCESNNSKEFSHQEFDVEMGSASGSLRADFSEADSHKNTHIKMSRSSLTRALMEEDKPGFTGNDGVGQVPSKHRRSSSDSGGQSSVHCSDFRGLKMDISEGAGISVLLKRSNSAKGPVVQLKTFVASSITCDRLSSNHNPNYGIERVTQAEIVASENDEASISNEQSSGHQNESNRVMDASISCQLEENSVASVQNYQQCPSHENEGVSISATKTENCCPGDVLVDSKGTAGEIQDEGTLEDSTVSKPRSLTLEEATEAILFCSSIVHDLAYRAATIAIEKEDSITPLEGSWPTVTILGKSSADSDNRTPVKRPTKSQKVKQKRAEVDIKSPARKTENDENADVSMARNVSIPNNVDSTKPPKLESKCNCTIM